MKQLLNILLSVLLVMNSCKSYTQINTNKEVIIDPIETSPYIINYNSIVVLPDSLGGNRYKGLAAIEGEINDSLKIEGVKIMKLQLFTLYQDTVINYYFGKDSLSLKYIYPPDVDVYLPFFEDFVKTVQIKKQVNVSPNKLMNSTTLILRFK